MNNINQNEKSLVLQEANLTKQELIQEVQRWVLAEAQLKQINEKAKSLRDVKSHTSTKITTYMQNNNHTGNIKISDGELRIYEKKEYTPLTFGYLEKCLAEIIPDETHVEYIIKYLKENREITTSRDIKRIYNKL